ncbi:hypothetical protein [Variovorax sp. AFSI2.2]|uniref:hypothetical protein n=1 Tax=Variovorax sp. AFSI2.2 TaxID=3384160 RepID=UPI003EBAA321
MDADIAASKADTLLALLITNHPGLFGAHPMRSERASQEIAKYIAAARLQLVEELKKQET